MSIPAISNAVHSDFKSYFQQRNFDLHKLGQALQTGDLAGAQQAFEALKTLGQTGPFASGDAFKMPQREQAFEAVGEALKSGDLPVAKEAFKQLVHSFRRAHLEQPPVADNGREDSQPAASALSVSA